MDKKNKSDKMLFVIAIVVILIALVNLGITFYKFGGMDKITGHATDIGTANLSIQSVAIVNFTTAIINWGSGAVDAGAVSGRAILDSSAGTVTDGNWTTNNVGLILQNDGNVNLQINLSSSDNATTFIGGSLGGGPIYEIKTNDNKSGSCVSGKASAYYTANTSLMPSCGNLTYPNTADTLRIDVRVGVPQDAGIGPKGSTITATATAIA